MRTIAIVVVLLLPSLALAQGTAAGVYRAPREDLLEMSSYSPQLKGTIHVSVYVVGESEGAKDRQIGSFNVSDAGSKASAPMPSGSRQRTA